MSPKLPARMTTKTSISCILPRTSDVSTQSTPTASDPSHPTHTLGNGRCSHHNSLDHRSPITSASPQCEPVHYSRDTQSYTRHRPRYPKCRTHRSGYRHPTHHHNQDRTQAHPHQLQHQ